LPRPLTIPTVMDLVTLADLRELIRHVPKERRDNLNWRWFHLTDSPRGNVEHVAPAKTVQNRTAFPKRKALRGFDRQSLFECSFALVRHLVPIQRH
jgi:hypothetical protein